MPLGLDGEGSHRIGWWAFVEEGHLNTDLSVSPSLVTFLGSEERSSSVLPHLDLGVGVHVSVAQVEKKGLLNLPFLKASLGLSHFFFSPPNFQNRI